MISSQSTGPDFVEFEKSKKNESLMLLWTGGWDSTFRLIQIVLLLKKNVQPFYIIDPDRGSVRHEMIAMQKIKKEITKKFPEAGARILPTQFIELNLIDENRVITGSYNKICETYPIGIQYDWLARFADQSDVRDIELTIEKGLGNMNNLLNRILDFSGGKKSFGFRIKPELEDTYFHTVFRYFSFPVIDIYKSDMIRIAKENNFFDIMEKTWFCHNPLPNNMPCGVCTPCTQVVKEGMAFRLPLYSRIRYHFRIFLSKDQLKQICPKLYAVLRYFKRCI